MLAKENEGHASCGVDRTGRVTQKVTEHAALKREKVQCMHEG